MIGSFQQAAYPVSAGFFQAQGKTPPLTSHWAELGKASWSNDGYINFRKAEEEWIILAGEALGSAV